MLVNLPPTLPCTEAGSWPGLLLLPCRRLLTHLFLVKWATPPLSSLVSQLGDGRGPLTNGPLCTLILQSGDRYFGLSYPLRNTFHEGTVPGSSSLKPRPYLPPLQPASYPLAGLRGFPSGFCLLPPPVAFVALIRLQTSPPLLTKPSPVSRPGQASPVALTSRR